MYFSCSENLLNIMSHYTKWPLLCVKFRFIRNHYLVTMATWKPFEIWKASCWLVALLSMKIPSKRIHYVDICSNKHWSYCQASHSVEISHLFNHQYLQLVSPPIYWLAIIVDLGDCAKGKLDLVLFLFFLCLVGCLKVFLSFFVRLNWAILMFLHYGKFNCLENAF